MKKAFFAIAFLLVLNGMGQTDSTVRLLRFNSAGIQLGAYFMQPMALDQGKLMNYAQGDTLLKKDFSNFKKTTNYPDGAFHFSLYTSFLPRNKKTYNQRMEFSVGLINQGLSKGVLEFRKTDSIRTDTFSSATTGMVVYKDSIARQVYHFEYHGQKAGIDLTNTYHLYHHPGLYVYAGYNISFFYSYGNYILTGYNNVRRGEWFSKAFYEYTGRTHLQDNYLLSASVPIGCTARFSKESRDTYYRGAVNAEIRIGITQNKFGSDYLPAKAWFMITAGFKMYRNRIRL